jgi:hypothetical protein
MQLLLMPCRKSFGPIHLIQSKRPNLPGSTELGSSALIATPAKTAKKGIPPPIKKALLR